MLIRDVVELETIKKSQNITQSCKNKELMAALSLYNLKKQMFEYEQVKAL